jgi:hypothetical protein
MFHYKVDKHEKYEDNILAPNKVSLHFGWIINGLAENSSSVYRQHKHVMSTTCVQVTKQN